MNIFTVILIACAAVPAVSGRDIVLSNEQVELRFEGTTGQWRELRMRSGQALLDGAEPANSILIGYGGQTVDPVRRMDMWSVRGVQTGGAGVRLTGHKRSVSGSKTRLALEQSDGDWRIEQEFALEGAVVERRVRLVWKGSNPVLLRWIDLRTPSEPAAPGALLEAPGYPAILHQPLAELPMGKWPVPEDRPDRDAPAWRMGLFTTTAAERNILIWPFDRDIPAVASVHRGTNGVWINHRLFASRRLRENESITAGTQYVRVAGADLKQALREFQPFWAKAGIAPQHDVPEWARTARIYEAHLGPYRTLTPYPDVETLARDLPRIRAMGFNVIQLMPRMPYPSYSVHDYLDIQTHYAPEAGLRAMVKTAHGLGLKVILDVIMHGVADEAARKPGGVPAHPYTKEHPEWFSRNEDGKLGRTYTWAFDHANSGFQDFIVAVFLDYIRKLDVDGFRVDAVTWNFFPNWAEGLAYPGYKSIYASAGMFDRVRREATRIKPELLFVTESSGPLFHTAFDLTYNYDELWMYGGLLPVKRGTNPRGGTKVPIDAHRMAEWLELRKLALPPTLGRVHQADSHDTKQSTNLFNREIFGEAGMRLVFAWCAFLDGGIMNFTGAEHGLEEHYKAILDVRGRLRVLETGDIDYLGAQPSNNRVFAPIRRSGAEWAMPVLSFSDAPVSTTLQLRNLGLKSDVKYTLREAFSGETREGTGKELSTLLLDLPPYAVQVWTEAKK